MHSPHRLEIVLAAFLIVSGLVSLGLYQWVFVDPTSEEDWRAASDWVTERLDEDDAIRIEPWWYERALTHLTHVGGQVDRQRDPLPEDVYRYRNIFVISQHDRVDDALHALPFAAKPTERERFGTVEALRVPVPDLGFDWELLESLQDARVSRIRGDDVEKCQRWDAANRRWDCAKRNRWLYVGEEVREVGDEPRRCVWAHPLDRGRTLRIEATVPPSDVIRVRDSFDLRAARLRRDGEVLMQVFVNDELRVEDRVAHDDHGWEAHEIDVSQHDAEVELRIEVDLLGSIKDRYFCLNAWTL